jgi:hypothetical protein
VVEVPVAEIAFTETEYAVQGVSPVIAVPKELASRVIVTDGPLAGVAVTM